MKDVFEAWWRALLHCLHPQVLLWSLLPLVAAGTLVAGLGWAFWEPAVAAVRGWLEQWALVGTLLQWLDTVGATGLRTVLAPLIVVVITVPLIVVAALLLVAWLMTPALAGFVARRRFPGLERRGGAAAWWQGLAWSLGCTAVALLALVATLPLWFVPPLILMLPPLIWGWLAYRVMAYDVLSDHASSDERQQIFRAHRGALLAIGVIT
ncbi:MAG: EI24 domain-containing protein, partial [Rubrivivax sp.]